ncbi:MAG TPA: thymidylate synthase [Candidatus Paceibacterota bacterium]|nr:thymidylate synthase [Candidatus Paceibacterota bacterium]
MRQYLETLSEILENGVERKGRNGWTRALWAKQLRFDMQEGFPAVTTKKLAFRAVVAELLWFLGMRQGRADDKKLQELTGRSTTIWTANADADYWVRRRRFPGDLGRIYGVQWRQWMRPDGTTVDQVAEAIRLLRTDPHDRRIMVTALNPGELGDMALPPCHLFFHFFAANGQLSLHMVQRSCDMFLGVPFNIASYGLLLGMVAHVTGLTPHELVITLDDAHIYRVHEDAVREQLDRDPLPLPRLSLNPRIKEIDEFGMDDIALVGYRSHSVIKAEMVV